MCRLYQASLEQPLYLTLNLGLFLWPEAVGWLLDWSSSWYQWDLVLHLVGEPHVIVSSAEYSLVLLEQVGDSLTLCRIGEHTAGLCIQLDQMLWHCWVGRLLRLYAGWRLVTLDVLDILLHCYQLSDNAASGNLEGLVGAVEAAE